MDESRLGGGSRQSHLHRLTSGSLHPHEHLSSEGDMIPSCRGNLATNFEPLSFPEKAARICIFHAPTLSGGFEAFTYSVLLVGSRYGSSLDPIWLDIHHLRLLACLTGQACMTCQFHGQQPLSHSHSARCGIKVRNTAVRPTMVRHQRRNITTWAGQESVQLCSGSGEPPSTCSRKEPKKSRRERAGEKYISALPEVLMGNC